MDIIIDKWDENIVRILDLDNTKAIFINAPLKDKIEFVSVLTDRFEDLEKLDHFCSIKNCLMSEPYCVGLVLSFNRLELTKMQCSGFL